MLYAAPVVLILAGRIRGCRPEERRMVTAIACVATVAFIPAVGIGVLGEVVFVKGCAYALVVVAGVHWAMLLGRRPGRDDLGGDDGGEGVKPTPPFDWDSFERDFWDEVRRRQRERTPA